MNRCARFFAALFRESAPPLRAALLGALLFAFSLGASGQECSGTVRWAVGNAAGGFGDSMARLLAQRLSSRIGHPVIVENKVGAGGNIAAAYVAKSPAGGCIVLQTSSNHTLNPLIFSKPGYELTDFVPVVQAATGPLVLVAHAHQPYKTLAALVEYGRAYPGKLSFGTSGIGTPTQMAMELFNKAAALDMVHVPYKGGAPAIADAMAGVVPLTVVAISTALPYIRSGKLVALAVTGAKRWPTLPEVPTMAEAGFPDATYATWIGLLMPAATPLAVRQKFNSELQIILEEKAVRDTLLAQGFDRVGGSIEDFNAFIKEDERASRKLVQLLKLKME